MICIFVLYRQKNRQNIIENNKWNWIGFYCAALDIMLSCCLLVVYIPRIVINAENYRKICYVYAILVNARKHVIGHLYARWCYVGYINYGHYHYQNALPASYGYNQWTLYILESIICWVQIYIKCFVHVHFFVQWRVSLRSWVVAMHSGSCSYIISIERRRVNDLLIYSIKHVII